MIETIFWLSLLTIYHIYDGYLRILQIVARSKNRKDVATDYEPRMTVLITVHNEEKGIQDKINNILAQDYPKEKLDILIASDGSTDNTDEIVKTNISPLIRLFIPINRKGKTDTQNQAIKTVTGEIIIFTDCDTRFDKKFLKNICKPFSTKEIGCVTGNLYFTKNKDSMISEGQSYYWEYEKKIRKYESDLGILAVASGACMAVRKEYYVEMEASYGEDCIIPLDIVLQGLGVVHTDNAIAYDQMPSSRQGELSTRVRMTLRNWQGTWSRKELLNPLKYPTISIALWSHKVLRWLSPIFLVLSTVTSFILSGESGLYSFIAFGFIAFYLAGLLGYIADKKSKKWPLVGAIYSFLLANIGFLLGLLQVLKGKKVMSY